MSFAFKKCLECVLATACSRGRNRYDNARSSSLSSVSSAESANLVAGSKEKNKKRKTNESLPSNNPVYNAIRVREYGSDLYRDVTGQYEQQPPPPSYDALAKFNH